MRILVNGVHLYFDIEGAGLRASGSVMHEVPTVILLHGGPAQTIRFTNLTSPR